MKLPIQMQARVHTGQWCSSTQMTRTAIQASAKGECYFHHNCPDDGLIGTYTKRQCQHGGGYSWMNPRGGCENFR